MWKTKREGEREEREEAQNQITRVQSREQSKQPLLAPQCVAYVMQNVKSRQLQHVKDDPPPSSLSLSLSACAGVQCDIGSKLSNVPGKPAHPAPAAVHSIEDKFAGFGV